MLGGAHLPFCSKYSLYFPLCFKSLLNKYFSNKLCPYCLHSGMQYFTITAQIIIFVCYAIQHSIPETLLNFLFSETMSNVRQFYSTKLQDTKNSRVNPILEDTMSMEELTFCSASYIIFGTFIDPCRGSVGTPTGWNHGQILGHGK